jgi:membrane dipeptidase
LAYDAARSTADVFRRSIVVDGSIAPEIDEAYIGRLVASGVTAANWTVCSPWNAFEPALEEIAKGLEVIAARPEQLMLATTVRDIEEAKASGRVAMIFGPQNALPAEIGQHGFRVLHQLGVRIVQLTYNERNAYGAGVAEPLDSGLSELGRWAIDEMNRLGIVIDLSHCGDRTTVEAIGASRHPVLVTHANSRAVHPSPRNKTDAELLALGANGGVIGVTLWSPMLRGDQHPTLDDYLRHFSHIAELIGVEHIGIGTDHSEGTPRDEWELDFGAGGKYPSITGSLGDWYDYDTRFARDVQGVASFHLVVDALGRLGLSDDELAGVLGGNFLRVFRTVWGA